MPFLQGIADRFWNYVSPRKTIQRRDKAFKVPALPLRPTALKKRVATRELQEMSPESRVKSWNPRTPSPLRDVNNIPPSPPMSVLMRSDSLDGDTLVSGSPAGKEANKTGSSADEVDANEDTMVVDDDQYMDEAVNVDQERMRREQQGHELREAGWSEDAVFLFQKLGMRGFEPLFPMHWLDDLDTLPANLFTAKPDNAFLTPAHGPDYNAQLALSTLFDLGGRVCDARLTRARMRTPEHHIKRGVEKYTRWAMKDGKVDRLWTELPLFKTVIWGMYVDSRVGERDMLAELGDLYERWYTALDIEAAVRRMDEVVPEVPTLYGVTASHTVMAFVSYSPSTYDETPPKLRLIAMFDFGKEGYDVWHSLAIAIFVTHCRNRMMQLQELLPEPDVLMEEDPDL